MFKNWLARLGRVLINAWRRCPLLGVKRTSPADYPMSAFDPKRTSVIQICCDAPCTVSMVG
jgi:hypothetical protein